MEVLNIADAIRMQANKALDPSKKSKLGQFFTSAPICMFMSSLFEEIAGEVKLLDPGCGACTLTASFVEESIRRGKTLSISAHGFDVEERIQDFAKEVFRLCEEETTLNDIQFNGHLILEDYILKASGSLSFFEDEARYTHVIMNPPYKKISSSSDHRKALRNAGIETVNLYTGFMALAIKQLEHKGELVAIIPRSFCNGPYYQAFREILLKETCLKHIHIFESRRNAFDEDDVLQENIIIHAIKGIPQSDVKITSSPSADFQLDTESNTITASDLTTRTVAFERIVNPNDKDKFIHIASTERDQAIIDRLSLFNSSLSEIGIEVSTGPVVDFRLKEDLRQDLEDNAVPLIYPQHLNGGIDWPKVFKKPNAINVSEKSRSWLWNNDGHYVIVRRFSSKEEKRRIVATPYDSSLPGELIGFENKLNVFHSKKTGFDKDLSLGLYIYLNSTLLDKYYRLFGGHTQVNATDLRNIHYPSEFSLRRMGSLVKNFPLNQDEIDEILDKEFYEMTGDDKNNPLATQKRIDQALEIITSLGMPRAQQNERSALTFLALLNLHPESNFDQIERPILGVTPIMNWAKEVYGKEYAPNTREAFRRQTLHQFISGGIALYNPDQPDRPVTSPKASYQIAPELFEVLIHYGTDRWHSSLEKWLSTRQTLAAQYAAAREMEMIPLTLSDGTEIKLSPGKHSQLIHDIVTEFGPRFVPGSEVIYLGDTGAKKDYLKKKRLVELGINIDRKGKLPDVVMYWPEKDWLLLVESVTSHGPVDGKRHEELRELFKMSKPGLVYVTAFPDRKTMGKYLGDISWETEVWVAEAPTHMIHFNGVRFLGPYD